MKKGQLILRIALGILAVAFLGFSAWIIHEANIGRDNDLFRLVRRTPYGDKIGHVAIAFVLTLAGNFLLRGRGVQYENWRLPYGSIIVAVILVGEEVSQYWLPLRSFDLVDAAANFLGILIATLPFALRPREARRGN